MKIGIIGYGRFGSLLEKIFFEHIEGVEILIYDINSKPNSKKFFSFNETVKSDLVIPAVPIGALESVIKKISPVLPENSTVMDVSSVKVKPVEWMKKHLKAGTKIIASHPVFGPDSTNNGEEFEGLNMMLSNISADRKIYDFVKDFWTKLGVNVLEITPEEHDRYSAYTINYNHLIGRVGQIAGIKPTPIDTKGFKIIYEAMNYVTHDSWELFRDMQLYNPYSKEMREKVRGALGEIESRLIDNQR
ncbi:MAG: prephenate dehydrogenase/arogenate dehydrogenase family protein [Candidatus Dojkabacteria bacterium]